MKCPHCHSLIKAYKNPIPTVDIIIEIDSRIVLIQRLNPPHGWALPGGFVDYNESYEQAAIREAHEETGLKVHNLRQFRTYSEPGRDPRHHTASTVFIAQATGIPKGCDDALDAQLFTKDNLPKLCFDHKQILSDYFKTKRD